MTLSWEDYNWAILLGGIPDYVQLIFEDIYKYFFSWGT